MNEMNEEEISENLKEDSKYFLLSLLICLAFCTIRFLMTGKFVDPSEFIFSCSVGSFVKMCKDLVDINSLNKKKLCVKNISTFFVDILSNINTSSFTTFRLIFLIQNQSISFHSSIPQPD